MTQKFRIVDYTKTIKIVDAAIQSYLIVSIFFFYDKKGHLENNFLKLILGFQLVSFCVNLYLKFSKKLKIERYVSAIVILLWWPISNYVYRGISNGTIKEKYSTIVEGIGVSSIPIYDSIIVTLGILIAVWYLTVCVREIQHIMKKRRKG